MARSIATTEKYRGRALKLKVHGLLRSADFSVALSELRGLPTRQVINPLISFLYNRDDEIRWRAITAMGAVVAKLADDDMEGARVIMRRLMWNLNDESGGIGWGSPEAMGEILACHEGLANEYAHILVSYAREDGNYLEHKILQCGLLWGIGRLSEVRPHLIREAVFPYLLAFLESENGPVRGLAAWIVGLLNIEDACPYLERLIGDDVDVPMYIEREIVNRRVTELAEEALSKIHSQ